MDCPSTEALERHLQAGCPGDEVARHVAGCAACGGALARIEENNRFLGDLRGAIGQLAGDAWPTLPGYEVLGEIHRGGQGVVYRARQLATKRTVAIKLLLDGMLATPARRRRFEREIELVAALEHPSIVTVFDSGTTPDGQHFLVMEHVDGVPLDRAPAPSGGREEVLRRFVAVCDALSYAHRRGVIHRDLKPANVLVDAGGRVHVDDFGSAKGLPGADAAERAPLTVTGAFLGTLAYASPEQVAGEPERVDVRTDVYSLGVMLYQLLAGRLPYPGGGPQDVLQAIVEREPDPLPTAVGRDLATLFRDIGKTYLQLSERIDQSCAQPTLQD